MKARRNKAVKLGAALLYAAVTPDVVKTHLGAIYNTRCIRRGNIPVEPLKSIIGSPGEIRLIDFLPSDGNVSALELLALCALVRWKRPRVVLELGTYDGNTALQLAANVEQTARVVTVDLPAGATVPIGGDKFDHGCVDSPHRGALRFAGTPFEPRIDALKGNTLELDFGAVCEGRRPDFVFIDAGHSYECVKNDTEKSLAVVAPGGVVVWHDYGQSWPGVYNYLNELAGQLSVVNIAGTSLVVHVAGQ